MTAAARVLAFQSKQEKQRPVHARFRDLALSWRARAALFALLEYVDAEGWCHPSRATLARAADVSLATIKRGLRELATADVVRSTPQMIRGEHSTNRYLIPLAALTLGEHGGVNVAPRPAPGRVTQTPPGFRQTLGGVSQTPKGIQGRQPENTHKAAVCADPAPVSAPAVSVDFVSVRTEDCATCGRRAALNAGGVCVRCVRAEVQAKQCTAAAAEDREQAATDRHEAWVDGLPDDEHALTHELENAVVMWAEWQRNTDEDESNRACGAAYRAICRRGVKLLGELSPAARTRVVDSAKAHGDLAARLARQLDTRRQETTLAEIEASLEVTPPGVLTPVDGAGVPTVENPVAVAPLPAPAADVAAWRAARAQETAASVDSTRGLRWGPPKGMGNE